MTRSNKIGLNKKIDLAKSKNSKECILCQYWYFNNGFKFQQQVCKGYHDLLMMSPNITDITFFTVLFFVYDAVYHL